MNQERMKYIIDNGTYVGTLVNYPVTLAQADSVEELERMLKIQLTHWVETTKEFIDNPFEAQEVTAEEWLTNHKREVEKWRSIAQELVRALSETVDYIGEGEDITETIAAVKAIKRFNENW